MRIVDAAEIKRVLTFPVLIDGLEAAHRRQKIDVQDGFLGSEKELYFTRHAVDRGRFMASKLITSFPANLAEGKLPAVQAVFIMFDGRNGKPLAVIDGTEITYWRTAADSALGAKLLAPPRSANAAGCRRRRDVAMAGPFAPHGEAVAAARADLESQSRPRGRGGCCH